MIILIELRNVVLETINNMIFMFNSYLVFTAQSWHIHFSLVNFTHVSRTITYNKYKKKNGALSAPEILVVARNKKFKKLKLTKCARFK